MATLRTVRVSDSGVAAWGEDLARDIARGMQLDGQMLEVVLCTLLAGGHLLLEDRPGVGKTQLARTLAACIGGRFARIQGTVDLLPTDVLGTTIWRASAETFEFHPGPIFANIVLVDELNRTPPKTQSGLLEAMAELQVTVEGKAHPLPRPFTVIATQNPTAGFDGTYALPPAQLDRFMTRLSLGYPSAGAEADLLGSPPPPVVHSVAEPGEAAAAIAAVAEVDARRPLLEYIVAILAATRRHPLSEAGASPRGGLMLLAAARAHAALQGRGFVVPDDVQSLAGPVLAHRIQTVAGAPAEAQATIVEEALEEVPAR
ncbi:MAG TPA: AAA family ATPase [Solirubrobacterales bacterium]|nr:AAA family ATPase [Solirubrobacterales bacterium]